MTSRTFGEWAVPRHLAFLSGVSDVYATTQTPSASPDPPILSAFLHNPIFEPHLLREILAFDDPTDQIEPHVGAIVAVLWAGSDWYAGLLESLEQVRHERTYRLQYFDGDKMWYEHEMLKQVALYCFDGELVRPGDLVLVSPGPLSGTGRASRRRGRAEQLADRFGGCVCKLGKVVSADDADTARVALSFKRRVRGRSYADYATLGPLADTQFVADADASVIPIHRLWKVMSFQAAEAAKAAKAASAAAAQEQEDDEDGDDE